MVPDRLLLEGANRWAGGNIIEVQLRALVPLKKTGFERRKKEDAGSPMDGFSPWNEMSECCEEGAVWGVLVDRRMRNAQCSGAGVTKGRCGGWPWSP
jgi:hypothetical protein